ncbi:FGGY-family carbohydrate kinase [Leptolyngbya sp. AN02str]|uniref:FGGY-family carbohydrate kinase n=1 Tax=Leptolyngbya sp. AN02str TaxID=3423363 RepID=UPI003D31B211
MRHAGPNSRLYRSNVTGRAIPLGAQSVIFLPHLAGERSPYLDYLDPDARRAWINLSLASTQVDLIWAVLEGVALSLREALDVVNAIAPIQQLTVTGGGARSPIWVNVLNAKLVMLQTEEGTAYGAALLAMVGIGAYASLKDVFQLVLPERAIVHPQHQPAYDTNLEHYRKIYQALVSYR